VFDVQVLRSPEPVLAVSGSVDLYAADGLLDRLRTEIAALPAGPIVVDLGDVTFLSFEGLGALVAACELAARRGSRVRVRGAHDQPLELLTVSGLAQALVDEPARSSR
jgi:anti-anti-sigma factor